MTGKWCFWIATKIRLRSFSRNDEKGLDCFDSLRESRNDGVVWICDSPRNNKNLRDKFAFKVYQSIIAKFF